MADLEFDAQAVAALYDEIAPHYADYYESHEAAIEKQGVELAGIINRFVDEDNKADKYKARVLDCSCGIGTQAIGLAKEGFDVSGCDISPDSVAFAEKYAKSYGVDIPFRVGDMRNLDAFYGDHNFDAVISCGNSLAHLLTEDDIRAVFSGARSILSPGGLFMAAMTDHENGIREEGVFYDPHVKYEEPDKEQNDKERKSGFSCGKIINFQLWTWIEKGVTYICDDYTITDTGEKTVTKKVSAPFRIWRKKALYEIAKSEGFGDCKWLTPEETGHHNPVFCARKKA